MSDGAGTGTGGTWQPPVGATFSTAPAPERAARTQPAGWWPRVGATLIDGVIMALIWVPVAVLLGASLSGDDTSPGLLVAYAAAWLYAPLMLAFNGGRTLGKQALGIRVMNYDGQPIGLGRALARELPVKAIVGIIPLIDLLWPLWQRENRALHDLVAGTWVVTSD